VDQIRTGEFGQAGSSFGGECTRWGASIAGSSLRATRGESIEDDQGLRIQI
jgi:hypothetical protein